MDAKYPAIGSIVLYRIGGTDDTPELRPAIVVKDWGATCVNLQVFVDGTNDWTRGFTVMESAVGFAWRTSRSPGSAVGDWRWP